MFLPVVITGRASDRSIVFAPVKKNEKSRKLWVCSHDRISFGRLVALRSFAPPLLFSLFLFLCLSMIWLYYTSFPYTLTLYCHVAYSNIMFLKISKAEKITNFLGLEAKKKNLFCICINQLWFYIRITVFPM